ncbi:MAG: SDR family oxidoreductase [Rhodospirillaceae bacterium]|nr:SDR family oxidoreductase [Rhodospirillaceae bacterium]
MTRFGGKVALVSNGASAIGVAVVRRLATEGASVMVADADLKGAEAAARAAGPHCKAIALDVASIESWEKVLSATVDAFQRLDVLVTVATATYDKPTPIADTSLAQFKKVTTHNLEGAFLALRYGVVKMRELGHGGAVVNVASAFATVGLAGHAAYNACGNGIRMMTKAAALSCAESKDKIRINAVQVGMIAGAPEQAMMAGRASHVPLARGGGVDDIAAAVAYLASEEASYVTGYILPVDGGLLAA